MSTMCESYCLDDINLREVSIDGNEFNMRLYIKLQGTNNKSQKVEQIKVYLNKSDSESLALGINAAIKKGLFK